MIKKEALFEMMQMSGITLSPEDKQRLVKICGKLADRVNYRAALQFMTINGSLEDPLTGFWMLREPGSKGKTATNSMLGSQTAVSRVSNFTLDSDIRRKA